MTNLEYLSQLNQRAGRSTQSLMQYPVFPWLLRSYEGDTIDLTDATSFRDLSKPMGAQTPVRRAAGALRGDGVGSMGAQCSCVVIVASSALARV